MTPPLIALEEHYYCDPIYDSLPASMRAVMDARPGDKEKIFNLGAGRLQDMDNGKVTMQVISHSVAIDPDADICRAGNDQLAADIAKNGDKAKRFAGFAILPMSNPKAAGEELERAVKKLGFVGALVNNKTGDLFYDGREYDVFWDKVQELDAPIYMHPSWPTDETIQRSFAGNYSRAAVNMIGGPMWGWHSEVGLHILRLHVAGVFDRFPKLKLIIGHFGEMLPFMLSRVGSMEEFGGIKLNRPFLEVWNENIWITTSGVWSLDPMRCILSNTNIEHILYSVDYPFTSNEAGLKWIEDLEKSGLVTKEQLDMIACGNAERLLGVKTPLI